LNSTYYLIILLISLTLQSQQNKDWVAPIEIPIKLSGTFGEIRSNHFHAGLDIRTQGRQGLKVKSVKSGWINRINVSTSGYGKALYIQHSDGTTSVYAHLKKFASKIESYLKAKQYEQESFTLKLFPEIDFLKIKAGELIGFSGNTGGSLGPHLHFEVRNTKNQSPINPLQYSMAIKDTKRPQIQSFYLYSGINNLNSKNEYPLIKKNDSTYNTAPIITGGKFHVGLSLFDRQNLSYNKNGIYKASVLLNGVKIFEYQMDMISFNDSKSINLFIDYKTLKEKRKRIQKLLAHPKQSLSFLSKNTIDGQFDILPEKSYQLLIKVSDYNNNNSYIETYITGVNPENKKLITLNNQLKPEEDQFYDFGDKSVYFQKDSFFENVAFNVDETEDTLKIGKDIFPLQKEFEIKFALSESDSLKKKQFFIAKLNKNGNPYFFSSKKKNGILYGKAKSLGTYIMSRDSVPPKIKPVDFKNKQWISNYSFLKLRISDDYTGIKSYRGEINGKWVLFEYEPKDNSLIYDFSDLNFDEALYHLKLEAEDLVGNKTEFSISFYRKPKK
jgi:hypothetical protein